MAEGVNLIWKLGKMEVSLSLSYLPPSPSLTPSLSQCLPLSFH